MNTVACSVIGTSLVELDFFYFFPVCRHPVCYSDVSGFASVKLRKVNLMLSVFVDAGGCKSALKRVTELLVLIQS